MDFFQVVARGCAPFYTGLEEADVFEAIFEYVKVCEYILYILMLNIYFFCSVKFFSFHEKNFFFNRIWISNQIYLLDFFFFFFRLTLPILSHVSFLDPLRKLYMISVFFALKNHLKTFILVLFSQNLPLSTIFLPF